MSERTSGCVVVASFRGLDLLAQCLTSLRPQCTALGAELVVARSSSGREAGLDEVAQGCRVVAVRAGASLPEIRGAGLRQATGEWVALTEDHCIADPDWLSALRAGGGPGIQVLGGSMGNAHPERGIDCGAFFAEYGFFGATGVSAHSGGPPLITQANAAYHQSVLSQVADWASAGSWENVIHDRLYAAGHGFGQVPTARVRQNLTYRVGSFCRDRYEHGRAYGATRAAGVSLWKRFVLLGMTPVLPFVLAGRILRTAAPAERRYLPRGLIAMLVFLSAWTLGEAFGYARGTPR